MSQHPTLTRTPRAIDKATRLLSEDRVSFLEDARVYRVTGDHHEYAVVYTPEGIACPCEARTPLCSHVLAVAQTRQRERAELFAATGVLS